MRQLINKSRGKFWRHALNWLLLNERISFRCSFELLHFMNLPFTRRDKLSTTHSIYLMAFSNRRRIKNKLSICVITKFHFAELNNAGAQGRRCEHQPIDTLYFTSALTGPFVSTSDRSFSAGSSSLTSKGQVKESSWTLVHASGRRRCLLFPSHFNSSTGVLFRIVNAVSHSFCVGVISTELNHSLRHEDERNVWLIYGFNWPRCIG